MKSLDTLFKKHEDLILNFHKSRPILATTNFSNKHIETRPNVLPEATAGHIKVFSWTENKFRLVFNKSVRSTIPLSAILKNKR